MYLTAEAARGFELNTVVGGEKLGPGFISSKTTTNLQYDKGTYALDLLHRGWGVTRASQESCPTSRETVTVRRQCSQHVRMVVLFELPTFFAHLVEMDLSLLLSE
jgi:hypothetical protein